MNIQVIARADVTTPPAGERTLFVDSSNGLLTWKYDDGTFHLFAEGDAECCACIISKDYADGILCALKSGVLPPANFQSLISMGFNVTSQEITDPDTGDKTCKVTLGGVGVPLTNFAVDDQTVDLTTGSPTHQIAPTFTPLNASNKGVDYVSSDPTKATVSTNGLLTRVANGTTTVSAIPQGDPTLTKLIVVTVAT